MSIYVQGEEYENITKKVILFIIALKIIKYLEMDLTKEVHKTYTVKKYRMLLKEIEDVLNKWKNTLHTSTDFSACIFNHFSKNTA